jgi:hypothetical protein
VKSLPSASPVRWEKSHRDFGSYEIICSAYLAGELGEILPMGAVEIFKPDPSTVAGKKGKWCSAYLDECDFMTGACDPYRQRISSDTMTEAMGLMLAHLLENKLITLTK